MEEPEKKSNWDDLARALGASESGEPAAPIAPAAVRDPSAVRPTKRDKAPPVRPAARPKSTAKDWDELAADLGIERPQATPTPPPPARGQEAARTEASKPAAPKPPRNRPAPALPLEESGPDASRPEPPHAESPEPKPPVGGAVSLWHKIFGSPAEQAQKISEVASEAEGPAGPTVERASDERQERYAPIRGRHEERRPARDADVVERDDAWIPDSAEPEFPSALDEAPNDTLDDSEPRRGRRRRRRGGRGRRREGGSDSQTSADLGERREGDRSRHGRSGPRRADDTWPDDTRHTAADDDVLEDVMAEPGGDTELETDEAGAEPAGRGAAAASRNIPSWEEAIGFIVDTNLAARPDRRRSTSQGSRGSGSSRGGRSRRRRGGRKQ